MPSYLTDQPLDAAPLMREVASESCGGTAVFLGTVRSSAQDGTIEGIEYSAYREMAEAEFDRILAETKERWPMARIAIRHRLGYVPAGEASIAIAVASPHRAEAFDACRHVIEETKQRVPVWKKERFASGATRWVEGAHV